MRDLFVVFQVFLAAVAFAGVGAIMARKRGLSIPVGFMLGFCFGPFGYIAISLLAEAKGRSDVSIYDRIAKMAAQNGASAARGGREQKKPRNDAGAASGDLET